jgi:hypothetical protein
MTPLDMKFGCMELHIRDTVEIELHPDNMNMEGPLWKTDSHINAHPSFIHSSEWDYPHLNSFKGPV